LRLIWEKNQAEPARSAATDERGSAKSIPAKKAQR